MYRNLLLYQKANFERSNVRAKGSFSWNLLIDGISNSLVNDWKTTSHCDYSEFSLAPLKDEISEMSGLKLVVHDSKTKLDCDYMCTCKRHKEVQSTDHNINWISQSEAIPTDTFSQSWDDDNTNQISQSETIPTDTFSQSWDDDNINDISQSEAISTDTFSQSCTSDDDLSLEKSQSSAILISNEPRVRTNGMRYKPIQNRPNKLKWTTYYENKSVWQSIQHLVKRQLPNYSPSLTLQTSTPPLTTTTSPTTTPPLTTSSTTTPPLTTSSTTTPPLTTSPTTTPPLTTSSTTTPPLTTSSTTQQTRIQQQNSSNALNPLSNVITANAHRTSQQTATLGGTTRAPVNAMNAASSSNNSGKRTSNWFSKSNKQRNVSSTRGVHTSPKVVQPSVTTNATASSNNSQKPTSVSKSKTQQKLVKTPIITPRSRSTTASSSTSSSSSLNGEEGSQPPESPQSSSATLNLNAHEDDHRNQESIEGPETSPIITSSSSTNGVNNNFNRRILPDATVEDIGEDPEENSQEFNQSQQPEPTAGINIETPPSIITSSSSSDSSESQVFNQSQEPTIDGIAAQQHGLNNNDSNTATLAGGAAQNTSQQTIPKQFQSQQTPSEGPPSPPPRNRKLTKNTVTGGGTVERAISSTQVKTLYGNPPPEAENRQGSNGKSTECQCKNGHPINAHGKPTNAIRCRNSGHVPSCPAVQPDIQVNRTELTNTEETIDSSHLKPVKNLIKRFEKTAKTWTIPNNIDSVTEYGIDVLEGTYDYNPVSNELILKRKKRYKGFRGNTN